MTDELFGPVVTCYVYPADKYTETLEIAQSTSSYALTGALFARDREAIVYGKTLLRRREEYIHYTYFSNPASPCLPHSFPPFILYYNIRILRTEKCCWKFLHQ